MPHVLVKMLVGRSEEQKSRIAAEITKAVMAGASCDEPAVSVCIEDIAADAWTDNVYEPDIVGHWEQLYKKPGYGRKAAD